MRFHFGSLPKNDGFRPAETGWSRLREPRPWLMQVMALPVALVALTLVVASWSSLVGPAPRLFEVASRGPGPVLVIAAVMLLTIPAHELVHLVLHPGAGRSSASIVGFWPETLLFYAHYDEAMTKQRFLAILGGPFFALSVLPVVFSALTGWGHSLVLGVAAFNALAASGDLLGLLLISLQVPRTALVRNLGYYTWWRESATVD